jgi:hypothetical protein
MRRILICGAVVFQLAMLVAAPASAKTTFTFVFETENALADFEQVDGCVQTDVRVGGEDRRLVGNVNLSREETHTIGVHVFSKDRCTDTVLIDALTFPSSEVADSDFVVEPDMSGARLSATVEAHDSVSGTDVPITVDVAWSPLGPPETTTGRRRNVLSDGTIVVSSFRIEDQLATALGTISLAETTLISGAARFADYSSARSHFTCITSFDNVENCFEDPED